MRAYKTLHELAAVPITELLTYKHDVVAYDMPDARTKLRPMLLDTISIINDSVLSGFCMSESVFKATHYLDNCDTYPN